MIASLVTSQLRGSKTSSSYLGSPHPSILNDHSYLESPKPPPPRPVPYSLLQEMILYVAAKEEDRDCKGQDKPCLEGSRFTSASDWNATEAKGTLTLSVVRRKWPRCQEAAT